MKSVINRSRIQGKWLRFYLDFCHKYALPEAKTESLPHFVQKLRERNQKPFQVGQAEQAVSIYYEIVEQMRVRNGNNTGKQAGKHVALCPATGMTISEGTYPAVSGETKGIYPPSRNIKGFDVSKRRAINTQVQKVCESPERKAPNNQSEQRARNGIDRIQTGMDWKPAFEGLTSVIKVKHYSPSIKKSEALQARHCPYLSALCRVPDYAE